MQRFEKDVPALVCSSYRVVVEHRSKSSFGLSCQLALWLTGYHELRRHSQRESEMGEALDHAAKTGPLLGADRTHFVVTIRSRNTHSVR